MALGQADSRRHVVGGGPSQTGNVKGTFDGSVSLPNSIIAYEPIEFDDPDDFDSHDTHDPVGDPIFFPGPVAVSGWQAVNCGCVELDNLSYNEVGVDHQFGSTPAPFFRGLRCSPTTTAQNTKLPMIAGVGFTPDSINSLGVMAGGAVVPLFMARNAIAVWPTEGQGGGEVNARNDVISQGVVTGQMNARRDAPAGSGRQESFHVARTTSDQQITNGGTNVPVTYQTEVVDLYNWWSNFDLTTSGQFTIPAGLDGVWFFICNTKLQSPGGSGPRWTSSIQLNGANTTACACPNAGILGLNNLWTASGLNCVAGDVVRGVVTHNYGGAPGFLNLEGAHFYGFRCHPIPGDSVVRAAKATKISNTSMTTGVWTSLPFDTVEFDVNGEFGGTTPTIPVAGIYLILASASAVFNATGNRGLRWLVDGVVQPEGWMTRTCFNNAATGMAVPALREFSGGEVLTMQGYQDSGGPLNFGGTRLFMYLIAAAP